MAGFRIDALLWRTVAAFAASTSCTAHAARTIPLDHYQITTYTQDDGAPGDPLYMAQASDGFLWVVSHTSLHRFDGTRFERWKSATGESAPTEGVTMIAADRANGLWITYVRGGGASIRDGVVRVHDATAGLPAAKQVRTVAVTGDRVIFGTRAGLFERRGEQWVELAPVPELKGQPIDDLIADAAGRLWIKTPTAIFSQELDGSVRTLALPTGPDAVTAGLVAAPDGSVWYWNNNGDRNLCRVFPTPSALCWQADEIHRPIVDPDGMMWWSTSSRLVRVDTTTLDERDPSSVTKRSESLELEGSGVFRTSDGAIWVHGVRGIARLRRPILEKTDTPSGGLASGDGGDVWLASYTRGLMRVGDAGNARAPFFKGADSTLWTADAKAADPSAVFTPVTRSVEPREAIVLERYVGSTRTAVRLDRDARGGFFVSKISPPGLTHVAEKTERSIAIPELDRGAAPRGAKRDRQGNLWIGVARHSVPLYRQDGDRWIANGGRPVPPDIALNGFGFDGDDTLWIGAGRDSIVAVDATGVRRYGSAEGVDIGTAADVTVAADRVWVVGTRGVAVRDGERFVSLVGTGGERFLGITGLVVRPDGELWLNGADGITRIAASEWRQALATPAYAVRYTRLDRWDGINSPAANGPFPSAAGSADGTLWFAMQAGLYRLPPDGLPPVLPPPAVIFDSVSTDDETRAALRDLAFAPDTYRIAVVFSAPGAQRPERTRFRYRLSKDGAWDPWLPIGTERQITFSRPAHGRYVLEVAASGRDGDWSTAPTQLAFRVLPAFHQTWAFYGLLALALALLLAFAYAARVRRLSARIHGEMSARLRERERIARDLHDTLLQGIQGLLLNFQAIAAKLTPDDPLRARMERSLDRTQEVLREGRDRVSTLRDPQASTLDLADSLQRHARDFAVEKKLLCEVAVPHAPRPLQPVAYEELLQVGREAIGNAFRHSHGTQVRVTLAYADEGVLLVVADDGVGLPDDASRAEGRWGLKGMHERAQVAGALLSLKRRAEGGTEVKMFLPAARAYVAGAARSS